MEILLVDDEQGFRDVLARRLARRGVAVVEAAGGEEALALLEAAPVDVVVMDVKMPGMDGLETLQQVKARFPGTEVILLTGNASTQDGVEGIKAGAFDYLTKPVEIEHLHRKITQAHNKIRRIRSEIEEAEFRERVKQQMVVAERLAALGTMATGVAHEVNNPLAVIQDSAGWLQQILAKPEMADIPRRGDFDKALERIYSAVQRARRITQQLLQVVRTESEGMLDPVQTVEVDLRAVARECVALVGSEARRKGVELSVAGEDPGPKAWTDPYQLLQVLLNLVTNAIHATPEAGEITVTLASTVEAATITVRDTGCGISEDNLTRVFQPFFTTKAVGEGTGMGLYVSWGIVNRLGGMISVESQVGLGTTFTITLPVRS